MSLFTTNPPKESYKVVIVVTAENSRERKHDFIFSDHQDAWDYFNTQSLDQFKYCLVMNCQAEIWMVRNAIDGVCEEKIIRKMDIKCEVPCLHSA